ncbi:NAD(P)/FAD-dependent oxidoreductase [Bradyrhizobium sp. U87765 SZCCT0131]|uniref:flavin-containing monooxygenase n=1 Tax=unclassified Bradyrhizobium TaxID=2631580 RepID=UPI001BAA6D5E|nr:MULTISPECIES: NAD(P)/FAD-dependent oxidoreductase [unclassified Bradyrhizobium]MBR1217749.1 NAD(P)/FAD-dependent oxidoreductase [Bradyrhizobium sp. U87765 SZCCT0131]MBR1261305.1 NAD(P)/FAD-dependent oxidoreductase [Bradyrhizobium sp. U87765 SZCCT0134]MBR1303247.1 NAD(P)/FAD-dependent oxidoreductase [Bradyrhizobium sp. U87765 SZCCT0110]MBR1318853.1 NAD(P)/FAD-dependent oxidoreductase [Bradyrhizobium sp. U87765 SZCCT0109]MBR1347178.1 NAD(P)/FAD-dependent oxidoreductase [Bradyrhizobium sp. U87
MSQVLDTAAHETLRLIGPDPDNWVPPRAGIDHNVAVIGGGQSGTTFAFALRRAGIGGVTVIDGADGPGSAGVWLTRARMNKLRTPKVLPGPELGLPGLSFQAWYEARHGADAYATLDRIPRTDWAAYLAWYRETLNIPVRYRTKLVRIEPHNGHFRLHLDVDGELRIETARKVILANGVAGNGGPTIPAVLSRNLPAHAYAHTSQPIDFEALRGKTVAVIGGAASAFDAAAVALENGAADVHLFARRATIAALPVIRLRSYPGAYDNYYALPDALRWQQALRYQRDGSTPPTDAITRVTRFPNFHLHLASEWASAQFRDGRIVARTAADEFAFDFAIAGTGYFIDPSARPELQEFAGEILLWRDRFTPAAGEEHDGLAGHPYLGAGHEYLEKTPGQAPFLKDIHIFNPAAFVSYGLPVGDVPSFKRDIPAIVRRISQDLFLADLDAHAARINGPIAEDFAPELYAGAVRTAVARAAAE